VALRWNGIDSEEGERNGGYAGHKSGTEMSWEIMMKEGCRDMEGDVVIDRSMKSTEL
jgi:hypothetical protein